MNIKLYTCTLSALSLKGETCYILFFKIIFIILIIKATMIYAFMNILKTEN